MRTIVTRLVREPALVLGVVTSGLGLLVLFGVPLTEKQTGGIVLFIGAVMTLSRQLVTPSAEVVVKQQSADESPVAGPASPLPDGTPVDVTLAPPTD